MRPYSFGNFQDSLAALVCAPVPLSDDMFRDLTAVLQLGMHVQKRTYQSLPVMGKPCHTCMQKQS